MSNNKYPLLISRLVSTPLLLETTAATTLTMELKSRIINGVQANDDEGPGDPKFTDERPIYKRDGKTAIIKVHGILVHRHDWLAICMGMTSYERIMLHADYARKDEKVQRVVIEFDTPGGEVSGIQEAADAIYKLAQEKEVIAVVNDKCCSAGYYLAAQCTNIVASPTSMIGSIGVMWVHYDQRKQFEEAGITPTLFHRGERKVDGHPFKEMDEEATKATYAQIDAMYDIFVEAVVRGRGDRINEQSIVETESDCYIGANAVTRGLADSVGYLEETLQIEPGAYQPSQIIPEDKMTNKSENKTEDNGASEAAALAASKEAEAKSLSDAKAAGAKAAKERISAILMSDEAKGKTKLANHFAMNTEMSAEEAKGALKVAAIETSSGGNAAFEEQANTAENETDLGTDTEEGKKAKEDEGKEAKGNVNLLADMAKKNAGL